MSKVVEKDASWWRRNRNWALPVSIVTTVVVLIVAVIIAIFMFVMTMMKSSDAYQTALHQAQQSSAVQSIIGTPVKAGWYATGSFSTNNSSGEAEMTIPVSGPNGSGTVYIEGTKQFDVWTYRYIVFKAEGTDKLINIQE